MVVIVCGVAILIGLLTRSNSNTKNSVSLQNPNMNITVGDSNISSVLTKQCNKAEYTDKFKGSMSQVEYPTQRKTD